MRPVLAVLVLALAVACPAHAATFYVNQSDSNASDMGTCTNPAQPCQNIQPAVDKAKMSMGNVVQVLPDSSGATDVYTESVQATSGQPITLIGAGSGTGGTQILRSDTVPLWFTTASTARDLKVTYTGNTGSAVSSNNSSAVFERLAIEAPSNYGFGGNGTLRDSTVNALRGVLMTNGLRVLRTDVDASQIGVQLSMASGDLIGCIIRSQGGTTGISLSSGAATGAAAMRLRHVTVTGFATRVDMTSFGDQASLQAANSTFADDSGTDLRISGSQTSATLNATNLSPARTVRQSGAPEPATTNPLDVPPGLTADGHLAFGSQLIDRGRTDGVLAGDPADTMDVDGEPRVQRAAPDVGADEIGPEPPGGDGSGSGGGAGGGDPGAGAPGGDALAPGLDLAVARLQRVRRNRALVINATSDEASLLSAAGTIRLPGRPAAVVRLTGVRRSVAAGARTRLVLKLSRRRFARVRRALRRTRTLRARVRVTATDAAGNSSAASRTVKLRR